MTGLFVLMTIVLLGGRTFSQSPPTPESIATEKIKDLAVTLTLKEANRKELKKMGGAFATNYSAREAQMYYKAPNKLRFESKIMGANVTLVYNGDMQGYKTPVISGKKNIQGQPGRKQTLMDLGVFAKDYITTDYQPVYQRTEGKLHVFKMVQRGTSNTSHEIVWVNPVNHLIERRLSYNGDNILQKELRFKQARVVRPGIWLPAQIEVYNKEGKLAISQTVDNPKVNLGVEDSLFEP
jgi:outer membrane lipoprotein-sorting protein